MMYYKHFATILIYYMVNSYFYTHDNRNNKNNTYTSFKDFALARFWHEATEIIAIIDIIKKIVIKQVLVLQRFINY